VSVRSKEARELIKLIERAGGSVEQTGPGKLRVHGPRGTAMIGDRVTAGRAMTQARKTIARYTGLAV
jgi:hypothetical protein